MALKALHWPAPSGGINQVDPISKMSLEDCILCYNLIRGQFGLQTRTGYKEWCTGLTGAIDNSVRTVIPYTGSGSQGENDKLFAVTSAGIWDVTSSSSSPTKVVTFPIQTGLAGWGTFCKYTTTAGHFLYYCDEVNGLYLYKESSATWEVINTGTEAPWLNSIFVVVGTQVINGGNVYTCITSGTTNSTGSGPSGTGNNITDGTAVWNFVVAIPNGDFIGPSVADQNNGLYNNLGANYSGNATTNPQGLTGRFVAVVAWKNRPWFIERGTTRAWYLGINAVIGQATSFDFGPKMQAGGPLANLYNWAVDGGPDGLDTFLVGISTAGDVVIYQGTDPSSISTFSLKGAWRLPGVPFGRRLASDFGGDMLVASLLGLVPLSKLIIGNPAIDRTQYATYKISKLFNSLISQWGNMPGWAVMLHPQDNVLMVNVPQLPGYVPLQLAMSFTTRAWSQYRGPPLVSGAAWQQQGQSNAGTQFFFGTSDGRVCVSTGGVDGVKLSDPSQWTAIAYSLLTSYQTGDDAHVKIARHIKPTIMSAVGRTSLQAVALFDYNVNEPVDTSAVGVPTGPTWDAAKWDQALWQGDFTPFTAIIGATGTGRAVALALRGQSISPTVINALEFYYELAGFF